MRREGLYLQDIVEAGDAVEGFLTGQDRDAFLASDLLRSAVLQKLCIVGEAAARIPQVVKDLDPEIDWRGIIGLRNLAVHAYFRVDWELVRRAATEDLPELKRIFADILRREYPEISPP
jgi:uncharacterized protein with HEPN domain